MMYKNFIKISFKVLRRIPKFFDMKINSLYWPFIDDFHFKTSILCFLNKTNVSIVKVIIFSFS